MFKNARLKLTAWYLLIIMFISIAFSLVIYHGLMNEVRRFSRAQRMRIERILPPDPVQPFFVDADLITEIKQRIIIELGIINIFIFIASGALGYFLAGKTLHPIQEMVEEQNRFISDASHEFRTPLTALKSSLEVNIRDKNLSINNAKRIMSESIKDVNDLQRLSDSLLNLSQYHKKLHPLELKVVSLDHCILEAVKKINPIAKQKQIILNTNLERINIRGMKDDLINLFVIILDNGIKYSNKKTSINIYAKKIKKQIKIEIKDQGIGIEKKDLANIFERFYRVDQSRSKDQVSGYGLGLSIAKKIVLNHHGKISVASTINKGSVFTIFFPSTA
ncbi:MAG: HAMP domain-containing sensor histidine kinase [Patescibacteria group bacterium]|jgi:signal transduction histidine kinase